MIQIYTVQEMFEKLKEIKKLNPLENLTLSKNFIELLRAKFPSICLYMYFSKNKDNYYSGVTFWHDFNNFDLKFNGLHQHFSAYYSQGEYIRKGKTSKDFLPEILDILIIINKKQTERAENEKNNQTN